MTAGEVMTVALVAWLVLRTTARAELVMGWVWPVPAWNTVLPSVSQGFRAGHPGVDILYRVRGRWTAPQGAPIIAANAGQVVTARLSPRGHEVVIQHGDGIVSYYQHLETLGVGPGQRVNAGEALGTMGIDPLDPQRVRHLHFQVWQHGRSIDPLDNMQRWRVISWTM